MGLKSSMRAVEGFAAQHKKVAAVTETGILVGSSGGALARTGNQRPDWFREALAAIAPERMAYFMTWSNFSEENFDEPYLVTQTRGHEMANAFIDFYNERQSVFAKETPDLSPLAVKVVPAAKAYGFLLSPGSLTRVLGETELRAKAAGVYQDASFVLESQDGKQRVKIPATRGEDGLLTGRLTAAALERLGKTPGRHRSCSTARRRTA